ncbi:MAG: hypothetical protein OQK09_02955 [Colwellia sp.]|nr:hypothetical protein [Colwellia sp.]MCW9080444.1 hypothetical protein [Colwellia sp.]
MKQAHVDIKHQKKGIDFLSLNEDHKVLFDYIEKLKSLVNHPENYQYAITILEHFTTHFLEHVIREEQILQQHLPEKVVQEHSLLHQKELNYLDDFASALKAKTSSHTILTIALALEKEFKNHLSKHDKEILRKLSDLKR